MKTILKKYGVTLALIAAIISSLMFTTTSFAETKWTLACGVNYSGGLNTMEETNQAEDDFDSAGYYCIGAENLDADIMYNDLETDYIFFFSGHGTSASTIVCYDGSSSGYIKGSGGTNGSGSTGTYYISNLATSALSDMLVAVYGACNTGVDTSSNKLLTSTVDQGCDFALGWSSTVTAGKHTVWLKAFTGSLSDGNNVSRAILDGDDAVESEYGDSDRGGTDNWTWEGDEYTEI